MTKGSAHLEGLVSDYIRLRAVIQEKEEQHTHEMGQLKAQMESLSSKMLEVCNENDAESIRTKAGTVTRRVTTRYWTTDWEQMHKFIKDHDAIHLMEQRIHNGNMRQFLQENPDLYPAGLQADSRYTVQVRKPTAR